MTREPSPADKQLVRDLFKAMPLTERGAPIFGELNWVLQGRPNADQHPLILPEYCYNIFAVYRRTYFKSFPLLSDTVVVIDPAGLKDAKTIEAAKKVLRIDWKNMGLVLGIGGRCMRFAEREAAAILQLDGFDGLPAEKNCEVWTAIHGPEWVEHNDETIKLESTNALMVEGLQVHVSPAIEQLGIAAQKFSAWAYEWSPTALAELNAGIAEGLTSFLDKDSQLAGESSRSGIYAFLLLAWPEIKAMLESSPKKTLSDLHDWLQPFMRVGVIPYLEIETLRDVCAPPSSGIGLRLRPLKSRRPKPSA